MNVSDMFDVALRLMPGGHDTIVSGTSGATTPRAMS